MRLRFYVLGALLAFAALVGVMAPSPLPGGITLLPLHDVAHLAAAACAVWAATRGLGSMRLWGKVVGIGFAALAVAGFVLDHGALAWLHLLVAIVFLYHALLAPPTI